MNKKLESLYSESLSNQTSLNVLKKHKKPLFADSIVIDHKDLKITNDDVKTIGEVLGAYGKNVALSAKFGSFDNFRLNLGLPETGSVSLYSYKFLKSKNRLIVFIPDENIDLRLRNLNILVDGKSLHVLSTQTVKTTITESVRIGKNGADKPFIQKVKFPLTVIKVEYSTESNGNESKDLGGLILGDLCDHYKIHTASGVFTQAILDAKKDYLTQPLPEDEDFSLIYQYQKKTTI